jgi:hypothetical protein
LEGYDFECKLKGAAAARLVLCVQVQYPDALQTMMTDLSSIRNWAGFLQKTEIKFDMLSAVDELAKQVPGGCPSLITSILICGYNLIIERCRLLWLSAHCKAGSPLVSGPYSSLFCIRP